MFHMFFYINLKKALLKELRLAARKIVLGEQKANNFHGGEKNIYLYRK